ncbi:hypothetical protein BVI434_3100016 [Burkholderia vietnamiensis]|nr:hypothetical protein BVI434_3100016 [Burkholderia vietnamiensis]
MYQVLFASLAQRARSGARRQHQEHLHRDGPQPGKRLVGAHYERCPHGQSNAKHSEHRRRITVERPAQRSRPGTRRGATWLGVREVRCADVSGRI